MAGIEDVLPGPLRSFFYGNAPADSPLSYNALQTRRKIAEQLMGRRSPYPKNIGEGLTYLGEAIGDRMQLSDLERREREQGAYEDKRLAALMGGNTGTDVGGVPTAASGTSAAATPASRLNAEPRVYDVNELSPLDAAATSSIITPEPGTGREPTATSAGGIPLPPPRPIYDRNKQLAELEADPTLRERIKTIARGESANPREQQIIAETIFNRAAARGQSLEQVTRQYTGPGSSGYYPATTFGRGQISEDALTPVLRGSDIGGETLGFTPTGNASGGVAARGVASGRYGSAARLPSGETYVTQERPEQLARLAGTRLDVQNPTVEAGGAPSIIIPEPGTGREPFVFRPDPARAEAAADMAYPDTLQGGAMKDVPPDLLSPDLLGGAVPRGNAAATAAPSPTVAPQAPGDMFSPVPQAQAAPIVVPGAQLAPPPRSPSEEAIPPKSEPYVTKVRPEPTRPEPLPISAEERKWAAVLSDRRIDPTGPLARTATQQLEYWKGVRQEKEKQAQEEYTHQRVLHDEERKLKEKRDFEQGSKDLEELKNRLEVEAKQQTNPLLRAKAQADLDKVNAEIEQKQYEKTQRTVAEEKEQLELAQKRKQLAGISGEGAKQLQYYQTGVLRDQQLRHVANDKVLAELGENLKGKVPVFGNAMVAPQYRAAKNIADAWLLANVRGETGAVIGKDELHLYYPQFFPVYGDTADDVARKNTARLYRMQANYNSLGDAQPLADKFLTERRERRASPEERQLPEGTVRKSTNRVLRSGYWEDLDPYAR